MSNFITTSIHRLPATAVTLLSLLALWALTPILPGSASASEADQFTVAGLFYFGCDNKDFQSIKVELPIHSGERYSRAQQAEVKTAIDSFVLKKSGHKPTNVAVINCGSNTWNIYIGLPSKTNQVLKFNAPPAESISLPKEATTAYDEMMHTLSVVLARDGRCGEDDSRGYSLADDQELRGQELAFREWALSHEKEIIAVLKNSNDEQQRLIAAHALGYVDQSKRQIEALVDASFDSSPGVRNNAIRALGCIASSGSKMAGKIPGERFIEMLSSGTWTDRNKAESVVMQIARHNQSVYHRLRKQALEPLCEMSCWDVPHALGAQLLLSKATGLSADEIKKYAKDNDVAALLSAAKEQPQ